MIIYIEKESPATTEQETHTAATGPTHTRGRYVRIAKKAKYMNRPAAARRVGGRRYRDTRPRARHSARALRLQRSIGQHRKHPHVFSSASVCSPPKGTVSRKCGLRRRLAVELPLREGLVGRSTGGGGGNRPCVAAPLCLCVEKMVKKRFSGGTTIKSPEQQGANSG